jgi:predicted hydrocarbon binding protein
MDQIERRRATLQQSMAFLGAMASGIEEAVGEPSNSIAYLAGKKLGRKFSEAASPRDDILEALTEVRRVLSANQCLWYFEPFQLSSHPRIIESTSRGDEVMLVFRDCMIRQSLFMFGHEQKGSLCNMMFGFFSGALESIMGRRSQLTIVHAGENACLKQLLVEPR